MNKAYRMGLKNLILFAGPLVAVIVCGAYMIYHHITVYANDLDIQLYYAFVCCFCFHIGLYWFISFCCCEKLINKK